MPHEITDTDTVLLGEGQTAWHGLGIVKPKGHVITLDEARKTVAPWEPGLVPVYINVDEAGVTLPEGVDKVAKTPFMQIPDKVATVRPDTGEVLGILTEDYGLFPNRDGFKLAEAILKDPDVEVATAGTLRGGRLVWVLLKLNRELDIHGDRLDPYLLVRWSHDGSTAVSVDITVVRVVCKNTWNAAESSASRSFRARHTGSIQERAQEARHSLKLADDYLDAFDAEVRQLMETVTTNERFEQIVKEEFVITDDLSKKAVKNRERKREHLMDIWLTDDRVGSFRSTGWGAVQAFSTWEEHDRRVVGNRNERRALRAISGSPLLDRVREKVLA